MALLHFDGFDLGILPEYAIAGVVSTSASTALGLGLSVSLTGASGTLTKSVPASAEIFVGFRYTTGSSNAGAVLNLWGDGGATEHLRLWWSTTTTLNVGRAGTVLASATVNEPVGGAWVYLEVRATVADTGGRAVVRADGATVIDFTGDTKNAGTNSTIDAVRLVSTNSAAQLRYFDDLYIADATGAAPNNTFLGPCRVYTLSPTGPGADTAFTASSGANWTCVDEQPYSAADYVTGATVGARDTYAMADLPASVATVFGVRPTAVAKSTDATAVSLKTATRSAGTVYTGTATALGATDGVVAAIRATDPATGAAWTVAAVNAAEAGFEVA